MYWVYIDKNYKNINVTLKTNILHDVKKQIFTG